MSQITPHEDGVVGTLKCCEFYIIYHIAVISYFKDETMIEGSSVVLLTCSFSVWIHY